MPRDLEREIENAARELAERYEEINLLYTLSEILGRTVSLDRAAEINLREVSETVGARRGATPPWRRSGPGASAIPLRRGKRRHSSSGTGRR